MHIIAGDLWAGAEASAHSLMVELDRRPSVEVEAILFHEGELAARLRGASIPVRVVPEDRLSFPALLREVATAPGPGGLDIVHSHKPKEHLAGAVLAARRGAAHIRSVHGMPPRLAGTGSLLQLADLLADALSGLSESTWITVSRDLARRIAGMRRTVHVVPNALPAEAPEPDRASLAAAFPGAVRPRFVGFVGRLENVKRPDRFVRLLARLVKSDPGSGVHGVVVGDGSLRGAVVAQIARLGLEDRVKALGHHPGAERILAALDALVICSDHEGHPMVLLEAMRAGVPVAAFDVGGIRETAGESAWLVPEGDEDALADATARLLSDEREARVRAERLREVFSERFTIEKTADDVLSIYAGSIAGTSTKGERPDGHARVQRDGPAG